MDLKHKGITWVGNVFQKIEAACQEVDSIIKQDTVKYVENQVSSAGKNVKKLYSDVVQGLRSPAGSPMQYEAEAEAQRRYLRSDTYFESPSDDEGKTANNVHNSSVGHGTSDQIDNQSQAASKVTFVDEEVAQVRTHSSIESNADLPMERIGDFLLDKDLFKNMEENDFNEFSERSDRKLMDQLAFMDASDPLSHSLRNVSSEIDDTNTKFSSVWEDFDQEWEDGVILAGNNDGAEEDTTTEFNASDPLAFMDASDPLSHSRRNVSSETDDTNTKSSSVWEDFDQELEDGVLLAGNNDGAEEDTTMEFNASDPLAFTDANDPLSYSLRNISSETDDTKTKSSSVWDDFDLELEDDVLLAGSNDGAEEDTTMEFNASDPLAFMDPSDPLSHSLRNVSSEIDDTNTKSSSVWEDFDLELEDDVLLARNNDGAEEDTTMEFNACDPLSNSLRNVSSEIDDTNTKSSSVRNDFDQELEDDVLLAGNNDGTEEDTTMEFNASDPLKPMANYTSCPVEFANEEATLILDNSHLPLESSMLSKNNDDNLSDENSDEFSKKVVIMESNVTDHLNNNHHKHVWSGTNSDSKKADLSNLLWNSEVLSDRIDPALIDKDFNESPTKGNIFEEDPNGYFLNLPSHGSGVSFTGEEAIMVSDRNYLQLKPELLARENGDVLTDKYSNESLKVNTILELDHDATYPLRNHPRWTSNGIKCKKEEVSLVSNNSCTKLESKFFCGKNSEALADEASDASCEEQSNLELSTESECEEDIVTSSDNPQDTIHGADDDSNKVGQASSILVNSLLDLSLRMEETSMYLENGTGYSSNASDAATSELASVVLTSGVTVEETKPVSFLKPLLDGSSSASRSSVNNFSSSTVVEEKSSDQHASIEGDSHPSFEVVTSASYENRSLEMRSVSFRSSLSSMESLGTHVSRASETAFLPQFRTTSQVDFSESTNSGALSFSTEIGCPYNSSGYKDAEMETVDLGQKVTAEDECDIVDYKALHAVARRTQKLRSYTRRIQDAFTSKKRLAKEYEQLAIWYGDTDLKFSTDSSQKLDTKNVSTSYASDSEWELL